MRLFSSFQLVCVVCGVLFVFGDSFASHEVKALKAFKEAIYEDPLLVLSNWNVLDRDPCNWYGISCSGNRDHVVTLNLSSKSLRGFLAPELSQLTSLQELVLHKNKLLGPVPKEIGMLKSLKVLDLGMNHLAGPIPPEIGNLTNIMKINFQSNGLIGKLPSELGNLRNLVELRLDRNKLQGNVPGSRNSNFTSGMHGMYASQGTTTGLCRATQLQSADFSYNFFAGKVPRCLNYLSRSSFQGNCFQDANAKQRPALHCGAGPAESYQGVNPEGQSASDRLKHHGEKPSWLLTMEIVTGAAAGLILLFAILAAVRRCKGNYSVTIPWQKVVNGKKPMMMYIDSDMLKDIPRLSRQELEVACEDFSNIIGSSPDSLVYKGIMKDGSEIAVMSLCFKEEQWTGYLELYFQREVADMTRINHENTAKLLGYCRESNPFSRMLVFRYASNGTLYEHLHYSDGCQLSWTRRMRIIIGIARGLRYLHTELEPPFTISELNSSAVYLTEDFSPKLVDFKNWKEILACLENSSGVVGNGGTACGFPESLETCHRDVQGNIVAFGVLLLEVISGRPAYCKDRGQLVDWAREYLGHPEAFCYLVDPELRHFRYDDLKVICEVVNLCLQSDPTKRTSMQLLCSMLENRIETSISADITESSLAWAALAISS